MIKPISLCGLLGWLGNRRPSPLVDPSVVSCRDREGWLETIQETGERLGGVTLVACQLGIGTESLGCWVVEAEIDGGRA